MHACAPELPKPFAPTQVRQDPPYERRVGSEDVLELLALRSLLDAEVNHRVPWTSRLCFQAKLKNSKIFLAATSVSLAHSSGDKGKSKSGASSAPSDRANGKQDGGGSHEQRAQAKEATLATKAVLANPATSLVTASLLCLLPLLLVMGAMAAVVSLLLNLWIQ